MARSLPPTELGVREALRQALEHLDDAETRAQPFEMSQALAAVGCCYRDLRALASAEATFESALRWAHVSGSTDQVVDLLCELGETRVRWLDSAASDPLRDPGAARAARERARDCAYAAARLASSVADACWEVQVLLRAGAVLDRCGDREDAAQLQARARRLLHEGPAPTAPGPRRRAGVPPPASPPIES